jgi:predicted ATPase
VGSSSTNKCRSNALIAADRNDVYMRKAAAGFEPAVRRVRRDRTFRPQYERWPACVPAVGHVLRKGLDFSPGLTVLVGENGSGKSTIVELLAESYGLNPQGGSVLARFEDRVSEPGLGKRLVLERSPVRPRWSYFIRSDTAHGLYTYLEEHPGGEEPTYHELSHGEGFLALLQTKVNEPGFYLLDEPDAALSFTSSLGLVAILDDLVRAGSQVILATHSPIIAAAPGAAILELGEWGLRRSNWDDLGLVYSWRAFLGDPGTYFRHLFEEQ